MENSIEVTLDGYIDTLNHFRNFGVYEMCDDVWDLFIHMVKEGRLCTEKGPYAVLEDFATGATIVDRTHFEKRYPLYAKAFTWEEFIENECEIGNENVAIVSID